MSTTDDASSTNVRCPRCSTCWRHRDSIGHCAGCHATFIGGSAFDRHQIVEDGKSVCRNPATAMGPSGAPIFDAVSPSRFLVDGSFWRLHITAEQQARRDAMVEKFRAAREEVSA